MKRTHRWQIVHINTNTIFTILLPIVEKLQNDSFNSINIVKYFFPDIIDLSTQACVMRQCFSKAEEWLLWVTLTRNSRNEGFLYVVIAIVKYSLSICICSELALNYRKCWTTGSSAHSTLHTLTDRHRLHIQILAQTHWLTRHTYTHFVESNSAIQLFIKLLLIYFLLIYSYNWFIILW